MFSLTIGKEYPKDTHLIFLSIKKTGPHFYLSVM